MNIQLPMHMEKSAFLAWVEGREGRYELDGGRVVMMTGGSRAHSQIIGNLFRALDKRLDSDTWAILADFGVDVGPNSIRYPDIVVEPVSDTPRDLTAIAPVLVIEVLSPSTEGIDLKEKAAEYLRLPSLAGYLVFAQDELKARAWSRGAGGFPIEPIILKTANDVIHVAALGIDLPLSEVYARVKLD